MTTLTGFLADPFAQMAEVARRLLPARTHKAECARALHELEALDERMLADIGVSREAMQSAVLKYRC